MSIVVVGVKYCAIVDVCDSIIPPVHVRLSKRTREPFTTYTMSSGLMDTPVNSYGTIKPASSQDQYDEDTLTDPPPSPSIGTLQRGLSSRQVQMIAIAGTIGTGLFLGTGRSLAQGGPASMLICYSIVGFIVYVTLLLLGEMATQYPVAGGCLFVLFTFANGPVHLLFLSHLADPIFHRPYIYWYLILVTLVLDADQDADPHLLIRITSLYACHFPFLEILPLTILILFRAQDHSTPMPPGFSPRDTVSPSRGTIGLMMPFLLHPTSPPPN